MDLPAATEPMGSSKNFQATSPEALFRFKKGEGEQRSAARRFTNEVPVKSGASAKNMPLYEYVCRKCNHPFAEVLSVKEHETKQMHCPKCKSADLEKVIEPFFAKTARKTAAR
jgi:putative FmdB family regulatory protein